MLHTRGQGRGYTPTHRHTDTHTHTGVMPRGAIIPPSGLRGGRGWGEGEMRSVGETSSHISLLLQRRRREKVSLVFNSALNPLGFLPPSLPPTTPSLLWGGYVTVCNLPLSVCVCVCFLSASTITPCRRLKETPPPAGYITQHSLFS